MAAQPVMVSLVQRGEVDRLSGGQLRLRLLRLSVDAHRGGMR
jgi:hypothetical protein